MLLWCRICMFYNVWSKNAKSPFSFEMHFQSSNAVDNVSQPESFSMQQQQQTDVIQMREVSLRHERLQVRLTSRMSNNGILLHLPKWQKIYTFKASFCDLKRSQGKIVCCANAKNLLVIELGRAIQSWSHHHLGSVHMISPPGGEIYWFLLATWWWLLDWIAPWKGEWGVSCAHWNLSFHACPSFLPSLWSIQGVPFMPDYFWN